MTNPQKILIIDDERMLHTMLKPILGAQGFDVVSAISGEEGLALAIAEKPDLILLDVMMPKMKGREVCAKLKADPATVRIPVVFLTAKDSEDDVKAEIEAGAVGHITKPINMNQFLKLVKQVLGP